MNLGLFGDGTDRLFAIIRPCPFRELHWNKQQLGTIFENNSSISSENRNHGGGGMLLYWSYQRRKQRNHLHIWGGLRFYKRTNVYDCRYEQVQLKFGQGVSLFYQYHLVAVVMLQNIGSQKRCAPVKLPHSIVANNLGTTDVQPQRLYPMKSCPTNLGPTDLLSHCAQGIIPQSSEGRTTWLYHFTKTFW